MICRKLISALLAMLLMALPAGMASAAAPSTMPDKLALMERDTYGGEQAGAILDRIRRLEKDYNGTNMKGSIMARVDAMYDQLYSNAAGPSVMAQANAIEWGISHEVSMTAVQQRITDMELDMEGKTHDGTFVQRLENLSQLSFGNMEMPMAQLTVPANTLIKVALVTPVNAKKLKVGDTIRYQVAEDVTVDGKLVFAKGEPGEGTVTKLKQARNFGRDAEVVITFDRTKSIDGTDVTTFLGDESKQRMEHLAMAAGASVAAMVLFGPVGIVAGGFVKGKNIDLPEGTELYIQTRNDELLYGVVSAGGENPQENMEFAEK